MGTRADFYLGRGEKAQWLGSIAWDGYPEGAPKEIVDARDERKFVLGVETLLQDESSATTPDQGWPWPWDDSRTTDFAYAWDNGVWISCFGCEWSSPERWKETLGEGLKDKVAVFPNMKALKNVTFGKRSGLIVIQGGRIKDNE